MSHRCIGCSWLVVSSRRMHCLDEKACCSRCRATPALQLALYFCVVFKGGRGWSWLAARFRYTHGSAFAAHHFQVRHQEVLDMEKWQSNLSGRGACNASYVGSQGVQAGTLQMEFRYLSWATGDPTFKLTADRAMEAIAEFGSPSQLVCISLTC